MNLVTAYKTAGVCTNHKCEKVIYVGDRAWKKGADLYCRSACLIASFNKIPVIREKTAAEVIESDKRKRIEMMDRIYEKRKLAKSK